MSDFNLFDSYHNILRMRRQLTPDQLSQATANFQELYNRAIDEIWRLKALLRATKDKAQIEQLQVDIKRLEKEISKCNSEGVSNLINDVRATKHPELDSNSPSIVCEA